ncbi:MAG TPA: SpoIIE family protein phosphatase [Bacteroidales bacterium]|nr:SpoIIE family protein phosphatase [Bacteroidales bacterium]
MIPDNAGKKEELSREELIEQRQELLASINYASMIQNAIFPDNVYLDKLLHEYFILHLPRDIVSGDFYYFSNIDQYIIAAAGDCTGHGVPGALMSIMGTSFLNEIMNMHGPVKASRILNLLRERVMKALHQTGHDNENKDSMDMSLVVYNPEDGQLQFSGANNSLYHVRSNVLKEIKPDKMPVGVNAISEDSFSNNKLQLITDDVIYLFSDGFADQFGGPKDKKFKYGPFKKLLTRISGYNLDEQKSMLMKEFINWKGSSEQVDDILVMGIKFM